MISAIRSFVQVLASVFDLVRPNDGMPRKELDAFVSHGSEELFGILMQPIEFLRCTPLQPEVSLLPGYKVVGRNDSVPMPADSDGRTEQVTHGYLGQDALQDLVRQELGVEPVGVGGYHRLRTDRKRLFSSSASVKLKDLFTSAKGNFHVRVTQPLH